MKSGDPEQDETRRAATPTDLSFYENAADIIAVVDLDFNLTNVNRRFEEELGMRREELLGRPVASVMIPETVAHARTRVQELIAGKSQVMFEISVRRADGAVVPFEVNAVPVRENGAIRAIEASLRNISERRKKDEALRTSEETARVLLNAASSSAFLIDVRGIVLAANQATRDRLGSGELVGRPIAEFLPPDVAERRRQKGLEVIRTGRALEFEDECLERSYWTSIHPIRDDSGAIIRLAVYSRDITDDKRAAEERKRLTLQLQQAQKMEAIGTLAGGIAHDFNNLLMAIQGNVSLVMFDLEASDARYRLLANIEKLVGSGAELTAKLLGYARRGKYEAKPLLLNDLVRETAETFGRMRKDIRIDRDLADDLKRIVADKGQLEQVLLNLFVNAADAMPSGGHLRLETRNVTHHEMPSRGYTVAPGHYVRLAVRDTGVGMDRETMARIFDPFFTTKRMGRGTGLGLASAYGIVKGHGGYIDVESEKGVGSVFNICLPATDRPPAPEAKADRTVAPGAGTVLLVDDELVVLEVTARMIERLGYTVVMAASGHEALTLYRQDPGRFRLVILDMIMPEMGGGDVFDELKRIRPDVRVLLASGYSMQGQARAIMNRGCTGFIQKPFTMEDLSLKLQDALKKTPGRT
jgi:two-component system, cell cycle sensor histidine kinase and response regulator CckA